VSKINVEIFFNELLPKPFPKNRKAVRFRISGLEYEVRDSGFRVSVSGFTDFRVLIMGPGVWGTRYGCGLGFCFRIARFWLWGLETEVLKLSFFFFFIADCVLCLHLGTNINWLNKLDK
jgi:hypothetical protein